VAKDHPSLNDFGVLIAYVLPGFLALWATTYAPGPLDAWFGGPAAGPPTVGGFLFTSVAAVAAGIAVGVIRWLLIDALHHRTGLPPPAWDFALLAERAEAFALVVDHYYRYYQCYGGMVVSLALVLAARRWSLGFAVPDAPDLMLLVLLVVFFLASRDSLRRYYVRGGQLLRQPGPSGKAGRRRLKAARPDPGLPP
jgi:hypothetical protein